MKHFILLLNLLFIFASIYQLEAEPELTELSEVKITIFMCASYAVISVITALGGEK